MAFGDYPLEYDPKKHGPFDPARYYGKQDIPFGQVKLGELAAWFGRRNKTPTAVASAIGRAFWRWQHKYVQPRRSGVAPLFQVAVGCSIIFYFMNYGKITSHRYYKYH